MRSLTLPRRRRLQALGPDGYQEFTAGTIPVTHVLTSIDGQPLVLIEHERGFQRAFDRHLDAVRREASPCVEVDYKATWAGVTDGPAGPPLVRLELEIAGLRPRVRLLFRGGELPALWFLVHGADLGLLLEPMREPEHAAFAPAWILGPTPLPGELRRILRDLETPAPIMLLKSCRRRRPPPLRRGRLRRAPAP
jgi:hypothetical protein